MSKITSSWENITPAIATKYLETMEGNRSVRQTRVDYYAGQMKAGLWRRTHQGIAFNSSGAMIDGQHRMWAIVESGEAVDIMVTRGVCDDDVAAVDNGLARDYQDIAHYAGWGTNPLTASIARMMVHGLSSRGYLVPPEIAHQWYEHYKDAIDFALDLRSHNRAATKMLTLSMTTPFARAWYSVDHAILTRFGEGLRTGVVAAAADHAVLVLRDAWLTKRIGGQQEQYAKTEAAIRAFAGRRKISKIQSAESELFAIPKLPMALRYNTPSAKPLTNTKANAAGVAA